MSDALHERDSSHASHAHKEHATSIKRGSGVVLIDCGRLRLGLGAGGGLDDGAGAGGVSGGRVMARRGNDGVNLGQSVSLSESGGRNDSGRRGRLSLLLRKRKRREDGEGDGRQTHCGC